MVKSSDAFRTISEVAEELDVPKHVLRFWEVKFTQVRPMKRGGGRRYYRPEDVELLRGIRHLLYREGYTIRGVQKILREQGGDPVKQRGLLSAAVAPPLESKAPAEPAPVARKRRAKVVPVAAPSLGSSSEALSPDEVVRRAIAELKVCQEMLHMARSRASGGKKRKAAGPILSASG